MVPERVAEILADGGKRRGSGYLVATGQVLTAAHVVAGAENIEVRFEADRPGEWSAEVTEVRTAGDVAVLSIDSDPVDPVRYGGIGDRDAYLEVSSLGFPRFKLRKDTGGRYRDAAHLIGSVAVLANRRSGTLEVTVPVPPAAEPGHSPWEGMSGAPVFAGQRLIGLIAEHHHAEGTGRLTALRVDALPSGLLNIPYDLPDVLPADLGALTAATYVAQVKDIAPAELLQRDGELAELVAFCAGPEPYVWWRGRPWAGKSALTSWFVLHPPAGVRVASFFVTSRMSGYADADAFLQAMIEQLAVISGETSAVQSTQVARRGLFLELVNSAAAVCRERGERLLLLVDGLDEDQGKKPSIAYLLPKNPPDGVRVLVSSRPHPGLPSDVPGGHPLRTCPRRTLHSTPYARHIEDGAKHELGELLRQPEMVDVLGLITASGGGLTLKDLVELTGQPNWQLNERLGSAFGRSLYVRTREMTDRVYLFAHETLRVEAEEALGTSAVRHYRRRLHDWAKDYQRRGWPETTPGYLLQPYGRLLLTRSDLRRLTRLCTDRARHDLMLHRTGSDLTAQTELAAVQELIREQDRPDLIAATLLAEEHARLAERGGSIPPRLPALFARLGQPDRAESLAGASNSVYAYAPLAVALAEVAPNRARAVLEKALRLTRRIRSDWERSTYLIELIEPQARIDPEAVAPLADEIRADIASSEFDIGLDDLARALASAGFPDLAEQCAESVADGYETAAVLTVTAEIVCVDDPDRARTLLTKADELIGHDETGWGLTSRAWARLDPERAAAQAEAVWAAFGADTNESTRVPDSYAARAAAAAIGDHDRVWQAITELKRRGRDARGELGELLEALVRDGRTERAAQLAAEFDHAEGESPGKAALSEALARLGKVDEAERLARELAGPGATVTPLIAAAESLLTVDRTRAAALAEDALRFSRISDSRAHRLATLSAVAEHLAAIDPERARSAGDAVVAMRPTAKDDPQDAACALAIAGHIAQAHDLLTACAPSGDPWSAISVAKVLIRIGRVGDAAILISETHPDLDGFAADLTLVAKALERGRPRSEAVRAALDIARTGLFSIHRVRTRTALLAALAERGVLRKARRLLKTYPPRHPGRGPDLDFPWVPENERGQWWVSAPALGALALAIGEHDPATARHFIDVGLAMLPGELHGEAITAMADLAAGLAHLDLQEARQLARRAADPAAVPEDHRQAFRGEPLIRCVVAMLHARLFDEAEQTAREIGDDDNQAMALALVAEHWAADAPGQAARITAELLSGQHWLKAFPALAVLEPNALRAVQDAVTP